MNTIDFNALSDQLNVWKDNNIIWLEKEGTTLAHFDVDHYAKVREARAVKELMNGTQKTK